MATGAGGPQGLEAVVLAAGTGSRFGGGKLLAPFRDGVLLDGALAAAFAAPARNVWVVTGADAAAVGSAARAFADRIGQAERLRLVHASDHAEGMGASLRTAVAALPQDAAGAFVFLGDMPRVPAAVLPALAQALAAGAPAAAPIWRGRRGNPVLLGRVLFPQLLTLTGDQGARAVLQALGDRLALVEAPDDGVLFDVDERGDLSR
ncbi:NTP transferase domain-containing protein [Phenylobacterium terrae]|uniref:NTP transferase domain-containing protein n=1 Tax=Phenylobacterium terrae TaxID=2665495 RepID=A0ABW4MZI2_9CAUL